MSEAAKVPICRYGFQDEDESLKSKCQEILGISLQGYRDVTGAAFYLSRMKGASEFDCNEIKKAFSLVLDSILTSEDGAIPSYLREQKTIIEDTRNLFREPDRLSGETDHSNRRSSASIEPTTTKRELMLAILQTEDERLRLQQGMKTLKDEERGQVEELEESYFELTDGEYGKIDDPVIAVGAMEALRHAHAETETLLKSAAALIQKLTNEIPWTEHHGDRSDGGSTSRETSLPRLPASALLGFPHVTGLGGGRSRSRSRSASSGKRGRSIPRSSLRETSTEAELTSVGPGDVPTQINSAYRRYLFYIPP